MEKRFVKRKTGKFLAAAVAAAGLAGMAPSQSDASLIIDVRAIAAGSTPGVVVNGKSVALLTGTETVRFEIFARVSGTDGNINNEGFQSVNASFNTVGDIKGNMSLPTGTAATQGGPISPFRNLGLGAQNGSLVDWDSDGDIDLGTGNDETITGKFVARSTAMISTNRASDANPDDFNRWTTIDANTSEIRIGRFQWTATGAGTLSQLLFKERLALEGGLWVEDDASLVSTKNGSNGNIDGGAPVNITMVPEPTSLGLMALAGLGLVRRRKA